MSFHFDLAFLDYNIKSAQTIRKPKKGSMGKMVYERCDLVTEASIF